MTYGSNPFGSTEYGGITPLNTPFIFYLLADCIHLTMGLFGANEKLNTATNWTLFAPTATDWTYKQGV